jgi:hypothetical protein
MFCHRLKALRLAPQFLHNRVNVARKLSYLPNETLERVRSSRAEGLDKSSRRAWRTASQERQARPDDPGVCEESADSR